MGQVGDGERHAHRTTRLDNPSGSLASRTRGLQRDSLSADEFQDARRLDADQDVSRNDSQLADRLLHHQGEGPTRVAVVRDRRIDAAQRPWSAEAGDSTAR